jgi:hypothetical protein
LGIGKVGDSSVHGELFEGPHSHPCGVKGMPSFLKEKEQILKPVQKLDSGQGNGIYPESLAQAFV